ncbi:hypothetical protein CFP56_032834 [Quercus suber]|uniref:Uncharacterized protein n=1 Tax=Quercus suber TaxID=58331 RepID=A0AAW0LT75_QUESU
MEYEGRSDDFASRLLNHRSCHGVALQ